MLWNPRRGSTATYVDAFDDTDFSEWSGETGRLSSVTSPVQQGSRAAELTTDGTSPVYSQPGDGLPNYIPQGTRFRVWNQVNELINQTDIRYGRSSSSDYFEVEFEWGDGTLVLIRNDSTDGVSVLGSASMTVSADSWYQLDVTWDDGTLGGNAGDHTVDLLDTGGSSVLGSTITANDTHNDTNEGVQITNSGTSGSTVLYVDGWEIV